MGMFDTVICEYPLPDGFDGQLQTKDGPHLLTLLYITKEGLIFEDVYPWWIKSDEIVKERVQRKYDGAFRFYGGEFVDGEFVYHTYTAAFVDGVLQSLVLDDLT